MTDLLPPWSQVPCATCGEVYQATRTEPGPSGDCNDCERYNAGFADGVAHAQRNCQRGAVDIGEDLQRIRVDLGEADHYFHGDGSGHELAWQDGGHALVAAIQRCLTVLEALANG